MGIYPSMEKTLRRFYPWFLILNLSLVGLAGIWFWKETHQEWKIYQKEYLKRELAKTVDYKEKKVLLSAPLQIKQTILPELKRVDRCITCHLGVDDPTYAQADLPFRYHINADQHPFDKFGCTVCHQGQGRATTVKDAHGSVRHWLSPLLPAEYIYSSCGKCHLSGDVPEMEKLNLGKQLFKEKGCQGCHKLFGEGGNIGPDLTYVARPGHRSPAWLFEHFKNPQKVSPGSVMPSFGFTDEEAKALTVFMLSLTDERITGYYSSKKLLPSVELGRHLFEEKGCIGCHSVRGTGGNVGPELSEVGIRRSAEWIMRHFKEPQAVSPGSIMPRFGFTDEEVKALTMFLLKLSGEDIVGYIRLPGALTPVERGKAVFKKYGCAGCHGIEGKGGVKNPNAQTGEEVPSLTYVAEGYTKDELKKRVIVGVPIVERQDPSKGAPPLNMPSWKDKITDEELNDLIAYLFNLMPESGEAW